MTTYNTLDVTVIEPKLKHPTIFRKFDDLQAGEEFVIFNDHDPKPLYYQLLGERGNIFGWEYLESGPDFWKVRISKNKAGEAELQIGEIVTKDFRKAEIFKKFNIDFCCGGKKSLSQVCEEKKLNIDEIKKELNEIDNHTKNASQNFDTWDLDFLVDYIVNTHHKYVKSAIPVLLEYTRKVSKVHGMRHPEVVTIAEKFLEAAKELHAHLQKEENILFPYIKQLVIAKNNTAGSPFGSISNPIGMMEHEHDVVGNIFKEIRELSNNYEAPIDACTTYKISFMKLNEFEEDLHQHIHLENNILFPKSIELENV